jgi:DNA topoisomerase-1
MASLFKTMTLERIDLAQAKELLSLPRTLGADPADGEPILANNGRYGPYIQKGKDYRTISSEEQLLTITLEQALEILAQPKQFRRGGARNPAAAGPLREFGNDPVSGKAVVAKDGRFGVYVTDGETNASLGKGDRLEAMPPERAYELLALRREAIIEKGGPAKRGGARKSAGGAKKAPAKKAAAKKSAAKKS